MAESHRPQHTTAWEPGLFAHLRELFAQVAEYLHARLQLAGIESKEALGHYIKTLAWLIAALVIVVFGYLFLCIGVVVLVARLIDITWPWVMVAFAVAHFVFAVVCVFLAKGRFAQPVFTATMQELR